MAFNEENRVVRMQMWGQKMVTCSSCRVMMIIVSFFLVVMFLSLVVLVVVNWDKFYGQRVLKEDEVLPNFWTNVGHRSGFPVLHVELGTHKGQN